MTTTTARARAKLGCGLALGLLLLAAAGSVAAAERHPTEENPVNRKLLALKPTDRAADLAKIVGHWCIGTDAFPMGVSNTGRSAGYAYWSLRCVDGSAWVVQIDPLGEATAIDCPHFKAIGAGNECFKKIKE